MKSVGSTWADKYHLDLKISPYLVNALDNPEIIEKLHTEGVPLRDVLVAQGYDAEAIDKTINPIPEEQKESEM